MRLVIVQSVLPKYELPLLENLGRLPGVELTVLADLETKDQLNQYDPLRDHFAARHLGQKRVGGLIFRRGLIRQLAMLSPDVVILSGNPRELSQTLALLWCKRRRIAVGAWGMFHRIGGRRLITELYMWFVGQVADLLLVYSGRGRAEQLRRRTPADKIVVLSTAIDERQVMAARDSVTPEDVEAFKRTAGLAGKKVLLHVVRLTSIKRPDLMLKCFANLAQRRPDALLVWIGGGPLEAATKEQARAMGLADRMLFLGPIYDEHELALWYKTASVFVMATCIGLSVHHAMCYGVPVVTDDNILTQSSEFELLRNGVNGLLYRSGDFSDFSDKVCRILEDGEFRERLSAAAVATVTTEFTFERQCRNFAAAIERLSEKSRLE